jgi:hypothetical protein
LNVYTVITQCRNIAEESGKGSVTDGNYEIMKNGVLYDHSSFPFCHQTTYYLPEDKNKYEKIIKKAIFVLTHFTIRFGH